MWFDVPNLQSQAERPEPFAALFPGIGPELLLECRRRFEKCLHALLGLPEDLRVLPFLGLRALIFVAPPVHLTLLKKGVVEKSEAAPTGASFDFAEAVSSLLPFSGGTGGGGFFGGGAKICGAPLGGTPIAMCGKPLEAGGGFCKWPWLLMYWLTAEGTPYRTPNLGLTNTAGGAPLAIPLLEGHPKSSAFSPLC